MYLTSFIFLSKIAVIRENQWRIVMNVSKTQSYGILSYKAVFVVERFSSSNYEIFFLR